MSDIVELDRTDTTRAVGLLTIGLIVFFAALVLVASRTGFGLIELFEIFGTLASLFLSGLLVLFYSDMSDIQQTQAEIQRQQVDLQKQQHRIEFSSYLEIEDYWVERDQVYLEISNLGRGRAQNLGISFDISNPEQLSADTEPAPTDTRLVDEELNRRKTTIASGENSISLTAIPATRLDHGSHESTDRFSDLLRDLEERGTEDVLMLNLYLHYEDVDNNQQQNQINLLPLQAYPSEAETLEDATP